MAVMNSRGWTLTSGPCRGSAGSRMDVHVQGPPWETPSAHCCPPAAAQIAQSPAHDTMMLRIPQLIFGLERV